MRQVYNSADLECYHVILRLETMGIGCGAKVVYLDQNKWIDLARAHHGKTADKDLKAALAFAKVASQQQTAVFPLSAIHYMETNQDPDPNRRERLGLVMSELSRGYTLASYRGLVCHELEVALARHFPEVRPRPFELVSTGWTHAFGVEHPDYRIPEPYRSSLPGDVVAALESAAQAAFEQSLITPAKALVGW